MSKKKRQPETTGADRASAIISLSERGVIAWGCLECVSKVCFAIALDLGLSLPIPLTMSDLHFHRTVMQLKRITDALESSRLGEPSQVLLCNLHRFRVRVAQIEAVPKVPTFMRTIDDLKLELEVTTGERFGLSNL